MRLPLILTAGLAATTLLSAPGFAQGLTSSELWSAWQTRVASVGGSLTATEKREGDRLVLSQLVLRPDTESTAAIRLEELTMVSRADGAVEVAVPETFPLRIDLETTPEPGDPERIYLNVGATGAALTIRGLGERAEFEASFPSLSVTLDRVEPPQVIGTANEPVNVFAALALADFQLRYRQEIKADSGVVDGGLSLGTLHGELRFNDGNGSEGELSLDLAALAAELSGAMPASAINLMNTPKPQPTEPGAPNPAITAFLQVLDDGMFAKANYTHGPLSMHLDATDATQGKMLVQFGIESGSSLIDFSKEVMAFDSTTNGIRLAMDGPGLDLSFEEEGVQMPEGGIELATSQLRLGSSVGLNRFAGPQDWSAGFALRDYTMSEGLWSLFDPKGVLARDPMTQAIDVAGKYNLNPKAMQTGWQPTGNDPIFTAFSFNIKELLMAGYGFRFEGTGGLDLDFSDMETFPNAPLPTGTLNFALTGAYAAIDRLEKAELVPKESLLGIRSGLMFIFKPGTAADNLISTVEFKDKSLFLNGMKIR